ncbi:hypothetical protein Goshw_019921, partial [Gossypium schwendimanii]|nr:hypothetical protein [Gossypium schwendimanii]
MCLFTWRAVALEASPTTVGMKLLIPTDFSLLEMLRHCKAYLDVVVKICEICIYKSVTTMAANTVSLKLLVESTSQRVLFAEAGKDFVDFLFNILSFPVGTVIWLLKKQEMVGCLGNLYDSLETMNYTYIQPTANKDTLLKPITSINAANVPPLLPTTESSKSIEIYRCDNSYSSRSCGLYVSYDSKSICPSCNKNVKQIATVVNPEKKDSSTDEGGYVKGVIKYMIMDDLVVRPMSAISCITLLNRFNIKDVGVLEEKTIDIGVDE